MITAACATLDAFEARMMQTDCQAPRRQTVLDCHHEDITHIVEQRYRDWWNRQRTNKARYQRQYARRRCEPIDKRAPLFQKCRIDASASL